MFDLIFIGGSPGTGKTTIAKLLQEKLQSPAIEYGWIRGFHLDKGWTNISEKEEIMSFENMIFILRNYIKNGYKNIIVSDFEEKRIKQLQELFPHNKYVIFSLYVDNNDELKRRVLTGSRDSGFRDYEKSIEWNKTVQERKNLPNEIKIDNTHNKPAQALQIILDYLNKSVA